MIKKISEIDWFAVGRPDLSDQEREDLRRERRQQEREKGYQQLAELCYLGEYDAAKILANRNASWGYEIVGGEVIEKED